MDMVKNMGLDEFVTFTGRVPDDEMLATLSACDICVQPDPSNPLNDKSTMNKVMEYMALEKPVVAFSLKETQVSCGNAALYATPNNVDEFAERILFLADNPAIREEMGKIGRERVEKKLSWPYSVPHLLAAYNHALER
jgi:glycosyltransferase involved in cell wall biosynthesis